MLRRFLVLGGLITGLSVSFVANAQMGPPEYETDRPGLDLHNFRASGWQECSTSCRSQKDCRAYTFVNSTQTCWLKGAVPTGRKSIGMVSGVRVMGPIERGVDRPGRDLRPGFLSADPPACQRSCETDSVCNAWTWVKPSGRGDGTCWLKNSAPSSQKNDCCSSGVRLAANPVRSPETPQPATRARAVASATRMPDSNPEAPPAGSTGEKDNTNAAAENTCNAHTLSSTGLPDTVSEFYEDVPGDAWYAGFVADAVQRGIVDAVLPCPGGVPGSCFRPGDDINRAEWSKLIMEAYDLTPIDPTSPPFTDVPLGEWFTVPIASIVAHGMASGYSDDNGDLTGFFGPADPLTREQAMKMLVLAVPLMIYTSCGPTYPDVPMNRWSYEYVETGYANSIVESENCMFHPENHLSRAEGISFVVASFSAIRRPCTGISE